MSEARRILNKERRDVVAGVFERDGYLCRANGIGFGECHGLLTPHEVLSRSRSGQRDENLLDPDGIITLCAHHNTKVEDEPDLAIALGLAVHSWDRPSPKSAPRREPTAIANNRRTGSTVSPPRSTSGAAHPLSNSPERDQEETPRSRQLREDRSPAVGQPFATYSTKGDAA